MRQINIGQTYSLDLGNKHQLWLKLLNLLMIKLYYVNTCISWEGRTEELSLEFFK